MYYYYNNIQINITKANITKANKIVLTNCTYDLSQIPCSAEHRC